MKPCCMYSTCHARVLLIQSISLSLSLSLSLCLSSVLLYSLFYILKLPPFIVYNTYHSSGYMHVMVKSVLVIDSELPIKR